MTLCIISIWVVYWFSISTKWVWLGLVFGKEYPALIWEWTYLYTEVAYGHPSIGSPSRFCPKLYPRYMTRMKGTQGRFNATPNGSSYFWLIWETTIKIMRYGYIPKWRGTRNGCVNQATRGSVCFSFRWFGWPWVAYGILVHHNAWQKVYCTCYINGSCCIEGPSAVNHAITSASFIICVHRLD